LPGTSHLHLWARAAAPSTVVPANAGTHTAWSFRFRDIADAFRKQLTLVVMGLCFRRDDNGESYPDRASAPSIIATAFCNP